MIEYRQIKEINSEDFTQAIKIYHLAFPDNEKLSVTILKENIGAYLEVGGRLSKAIAYYKI